MCVLGLLEFGFGAGGRVEEGDGVCGNLHRFEEVLGGGHGEVFVVVFGGGAREEGLAFRGVSFYRRQFIAARRKVDSVCAKRAKWGGSDV